MTERPPPRVARRVYLVLACVCTCPGAATPAREETLRRIGQRLGLAAREMAALEVRARSSNALLIGREPAERRLLRQALARLLLADEVPLSPSARALMDRLGAALSPTRGSVASPFEESGAGPPLLAGSRAG